MSGLVSVGGDDWDDTNATILTTQQVQSDDWSSVIPVLEPPLEPQPQPQPSVLIESDQSTSSGAPPAIANNLQLGPPGLFDAAIQAEFYALRDLALPIIVSYLMSFGIQIVSQMVVGRVSAAALASVALANMFANASGLAPILGTANACDTLCSEAFGVNNLVRVGKVARRGLGVALSTAIFCAVLWFFAAGPFFRALEIEPELADMAESFIRVLIFGLPAIVLSEVLKKPLISMQMAGAATALSCAGLITSASLSAPLVFGTSAGYLGAAWASVIAQWVTALCFLSFLRWHREMDTLFLSCMAKIKKRIGIKEENAADVPVVTTEAEPSSSLSSSSSARQMKENTTNWHETLDAVFPKEMSVNDFFEGWPEYLALGLPSASMLMVEWGTFEALAVVAGRLGRVSLATHSVLATSAALSFMPFLGVSVAACVRVGSAMGDLRPTDAQRTLRVALFLGAIVAIANALLLLLCRSWWGEVFTDDTAVVELTGRILPILATYVIFDGAQCVLSGVLRGAALAGTAAGINVAAYLGGIMLAVGLSDPHWVGGAQWGLAGVWIAFVCAVFVAAVAMMATLQCKDWQKMSEGAHVRGKT
jgi:Na+-driven multidrug efflux pump